MNSTLVIARRELTEKRFVFVTALAFLALAIVVPFMPGVHAEERATALAAGSLLLANAFVVGLSVILGSSIIGRELSEGRLSFYFSKPLPATSIWWGKLLASAALIAASFIIIGLPGLVGNQLLTTWTSRTSLVETAAGFAALFLFAHVIGTFVRSRSAWFLFDFIAAVICGTAMWMLARTLLTGYAQVLTLRVLEAFAIFFALAIIGAGAWQLERGRTDRKRSHMELSRFLWISIGCGVLIVAAFVMWVVSVRPGELVNLNAVFQSPNDWALVSGRARNRFDYGAAFLYNVSNGQFVRVHPSGWPATSDDGSVICWLEGLRTTDLWIARLNGAMPQIERSRLTFDRPVRLFVSRNGSRLAVMELEGKTLSVYDLANLRMIASVRLPADLWWNFGMFNDADHFRMVALRPPAVALEFDVSSKALRPVPVGSVMPRFNGRRLQLPEGITPRLTIQSTPLVVGVTRDGTVVFDRDRGTIIRAAKGIYPLVYGVTGPRVICMSPHGLVIWNAMTGETRPLQRCAIR